MRPDPMALRGPVRILTNTGDDIYEIGRQVHDMRPDFDYVELPGGTHDTMDEQPAAWARAVSRFSRFVLAAEARRANSAVGSGAVGSAAVASG